MDIDRRRLDERLERLKSRLVNLRGESAHWPGRLSSSALATATAVFALSSVDPVQYQSLIANGLDWLVQNQNPDGGWGDTIRSQSNISTTMLGWAAFTAASQTQAYDSAISRAEVWLAKRTGALETDALVEAIYESYGEDRTFSVPILTMCALAGRLGDNPWAYVKPLPFELAALPHQIFKWLNLNVVSYALPALIAIGQANFHNNPPANAMTRFIRRLTRNKTLRILQNIQPQNGGFLEATPLTSFVVMTLAAADQKAGAVVSKGIDFLVKSVQTDGSWPIDTNLATWLTTLSVNALAHAPDYKTLLSHKDRSQILTWLSGQQYQAEHPYTHAASGGWAWTDLPGAVPDADDTAGALIALHNLTGGDDDVTGQAFAGVKWLLDIQNRDGGIPTFCKGWGRLPFDRSAPDPTAGALAAWSLWLEQLPAPAKKRAEYAMRRAVVFLKQNQTPDGAWIPLWFGNESYPQKENPVYGTARVLLGLNRLPMRFLGGVEANITAAVQWLLDIQADDGSWGGLNSAASSIEETALATDALAALLPGTTHDESFAIAVPLPVENMRQAVYRAAQWLMQHTENPDRIHSAPIGLYFARLWYYEELYPLIFAVAALQKVKNMLENAES
ncbi:MAG: squalene--hopene cyclase [Planctomycetota bacterium]|nr:MAG: squalene--hopene cyclase [Planctomycetota bacterium]